MPKIIRVTRCGECPHSFGLHGTPYVLCGHPEGPTGKIDRKIIHPDCPLEDTQEVEHGR